MKIGVLSIQGLPPRYGAFEQTVDQIVRHAEVQRPDLHFIVGCSAQVAAESYEQHNVTRLFVKRTPKLGVIAYGMKAFFLMYAQGIRSFLIMGYGLAPFFWLFELLGCHLVVNVDGFEWRRAKWGKLARRYFKLCESLSAKSNARIIYDSIGVERYYKINHKRSGHLMFYGTERTESASLISVEPELSNVSYFVVVMRMEPENHILEIVKGFLGSNTTMRLLLIGPSTAFFDHEVKPLLTVDPSGRVTWLGPIYDRKKLQAIRAGAVAYLHGHSVGGTNPTLVEACWLKRPVIAYNSIFNREVLGSRGIYFSDVASLTHILDSNSDNWPTPPELDSRYSWEHVSDAYLQLFR